MATRIAVANILRNFLRDYGGGSSHYHQLHDRVVEKYLLQEIKYQTLERNLCSNDDLTLKEDRLFFFLEPVEDHRILPIVTLHSRNDWVEFRIYALLAMIDRNSSNLEVLALRFETDEGEGRSTSDPGSHDFFHAQLCQTILRGVEATTPAWMPDSQPSFPLDAEDQIQLVLCMLTSVYGGRFVVRKLGRDPSARSHLNKVRALKMP